LEGKNGGKIKFKSKVIALQTRKEAKELTFWEWCNEKTIKFKLENKRWRTE
jgi:hypothetical protein